jgi:hypothetical protein
MLKVRAIGIKIVNKCTRMGYCKQVGPENIGQEDVVPLCLREICKRR